MHFGYYTCLANNCILTDSKLAKGKICNWKLIIFAEWGPKLNEIHGQEGCHVRSIYAWLRNSQTLPLACKDSHVIIYFTIQKVRRSGQFGNVVVMSHGCDFRDAKLQGGSWIETWNQWFWSHTPSYSIKSGQSPPCQLYAYSVDTRIKIWSGLLLGHDCLKILP